MDLIYSIRVLINRLPILIVIPVLSAFATGIVSMMAPKEYVSETQLATGYADLTTYSPDDERFSPVKADIKFNNLMEIIKSPILIGTLSYHLLLHDLTKEDPFSEIVIDKPKGWILENYGIERDSIIYLLRDKIYNFELLSSYNEVDKKILEVILDFGYTSSHLRKSLDIDRMNYTDYLYVRFKSEDPLLSAFVTNTLSEEFLRYNNNLRFNQSSESIQFLDTLAKQKKAILDEKSNSLRLYKSQNRFLNFNLESESKISQVKDTEAQRETVLNNIRRINLSIESIDSRITDQQPGQGLTILRNQLTELNERRRSGSENYTQLSDSILLVRNKIDYLINSSRNLDQDILDQRYDLNVELKVEEEKLKSIDQRLATLRREVSSFANSEATVSAIQREVELASQEYQEVQRKLNDAINANLKAKDNVRIVVFGQPAIEPQSSGTLLKTGFAFLGTSMLCIIAILFVEFIDSRIKTVYRFQQMIDLKLLGAIYSDKKISFLARFIKSKILKDQITLTKVQALRKLRYEIASQNGKILLVTSLKQGEGKSFMISELANSLGLIGKRVLIIDTNFRNNSFFKKKAEENAKRLHKDKLELLLPNGQRQPAHNSVPAIFENHAFVTQENKNVHIIPNRSPEGSPAEILTDKGFSEVLQEFIRNKVYDYIFLEGAAINEFSDALELSEYADKVIIIIDAMQEFNTEDRNNLNFVNSFNGKLLGAILNKPISHF